MAARYYDIDLEVIQIRDQDAYEACIFDGTADIIPEHLEYLFEWAAKGMKGTMFLCPSRKAEGELVVRPDIQKLDDLRGQKIAVRTHGRPFATHMRMRALGLEDDVEFVLVDDSEVGRWQQWRTLITGQCAATYTTCLYLPGALEAGLSLLPVPEYEIVGLYGHACSTAFARDHDDLMTRYVKAATHAIALIKLHRAEAMEIVIKEPARLMRLEDNRAELEHRFDCIAGILQIKGYPTTDGIAHSHEIGCDEWPGGKDVNPMTLWDLHWLKRIDDEGFIDDLVSRLSIPSPLSS